MLYLLADLREFFGPLRLFEYVTFRAGGAFFMAMLIVMLLGPWTVRQLKKLNTVAADRYDGVLSPEMIDAAKSKTPCMGGILVIGALLISTMLWMNIGNGTSLVLIFGTLAFALLGFADDFAKVYFHRRDGVPGKVKLLVQILIAVAVVLTLDYLPETYGYMRELLVPFVKDPVWQGSKWLWLLSILVIVGSSNAVNLTDGKDGLASGCMVVAALTYAMFAYLVGHEVFARYLNIPFIDGASEAVVFAAALGGACLGFLWHNCYPATMFMGDTGSLALGGAIGMLAVLVRQELVLVLVGGVFVMEAGSVMLQVPYFKLTGKRIFLCTPIHHHFERLGWSETKLVVRFWILSVIFALIALGTLKLR